MNATPSIPEERGIDLQKAREAIASEARFDSAFVIMNALAAIIASYALLADSAPGVIGAMLVAMLLGPIEGISLALVDGEFPLLRQSCISLGAGVGIVVLCALVVGLLHPEIPAGKELLARTHPNYLDLMIALAGGAVGAYAAMRPRISNAVVGVAIATALVPPLCTGTIFLARGEGENAFGGYLLAFANIVAIQFASSVVLWLAGLHKAADRFYVRSKVLWLNGLSLGMIVALFVILGINTSGLVANILYETNTRKILKADLQRYPGAYLGDLRVSKEESHTIVRALVRSPYGFTADDVGALESSLPPPADGLPVELRIRHVKVNVMSRRGPVYDKELIQAEGPSLRGLLSQPPAE